MKRAIQLMRLMLLLAVVTPAAVAVSWQEQILYSFQGGNDGNLPSGLIFDKQGNLYGMTGQGGQGNCPPEQCGTVFKLSPPGQNGGSWTESVLYVFKGHSAGDGSAPGSGLVVDATGNLYGVTEYGGTGGCILLGTATGCGTVIEMSPPSKPGGTWTENVLYSFEGNTDGQLPVGDLIFDKAGNLYGATYFGGGSGSCDPGFFQHCGTIFELSPPKKKGGKWTEKVLCSFAGTHKGMKGDGANPNGGLIFDKRGELYGTTYFGGLYGCNADLGVGCGLIFRLTPPNKGTGNWKKEIVYWFDGTMHGGSPSAGLEFGPDGNLYGTTASGGAKVNGSGTVFELVKPKGIAAPFTEIVLHRFSGAQDGAEPMASVVFDGHGNLYTVALGGKVVDGVVVELTPPERNSAWGFSVLYNFTGPPDGAGPRASLIFDAGGNIYGTTQNGGTGQACYGNCGTVFELTPQ